MALHRLVATTTIAAILTITLISGPLVSAVDFSHQADTDSELWTGSADVTVRSMPENVRLEQGDYGTRSYSLRVPAMVLSVTNVTGNPLFVTRIIIPELGHQSSAIETLPGERSGTVRLAIPQFTIGPQKVEQDQYRGQIEVLVRTQTDRVVARQNVTVEVTE